MRAKVVLAAIRTSMPASLAADSGINDILLHSKPAGLRATSAALLMIVATVNAIRAQPLAVGGTSANCQSESQADADSLVHSDHRPQITVKVASVLRPTTRAAGQLICPSALLRLRPRFTSHNELATTSTARIDQNSTSLAAHKNDPRSQNHCTACSSQVSTNTTSVETTSAATGP